jgi:hypothetical protein
MSAPWQYGVRIGDATQRSDRKGDAETIARDWSISPLRTSPREAHLVRRRGWDGEWEVVATWRSPEWPR